MNQFIIVAIACFIVLLCVITIISCYALAQQLDYISSTLGQLEIKSLVPKDRLEGLPLVAPRTTLELLDTESQLRRHGLSQSDVDEINKIDDSKMIDGIPVLGKGVYNRKFDPAAQLKGDAYQGYYD